VALKILPPMAGKDPGFAERFTREARALARLNHPNIVGVHDSGQAGAFYYLVMEFVDGANLREVERAGRLPPKQALQIVSQVCDALQFAHDEGIIHRDIKPENILLDKKGRVKITDFGIAKIIGATPEKIGLTGARDFVGTPHYIAPEQIEQPNAVDHRADIYSLGVVFYELLTGELPFGRFPLPSSKVQVDVRFDDVVLRALEKEPERRYQHASEVKTDVQAIAGAPLPTISNPPGGRTPSPVPPSNGISAWKLVAIGGVALLLLLAVAIIAVWLLVNSQRRQTNAPSLTQSPAERPVTLNHRLLEGGERTNAPAPPAAAKLEPKELTLTELRAALIDLKSSDSGRKQLASAILAGAKPTESRSNVVSALIPVLGDANWAVRLNAAQALGVWATPDAYQPLAKMLDDTEFSVRWKAIDALTQWKNPQTAATLAGHMAHGLDVLETGRALRTFGEPAEAAVAGLLTATDHQVRYEACRVLKDIGTKKSIPALTSAAGDADGITAMLAKEALKAIDAR
jgi:serine/threonine protein kinase